MKIDTLIATHALVNGSKKPFWYTSPKEFISVEEAWKLCNPKGKEAISYKEFMADNCVGPATLNPNLKKIN